MESKWILWILISTSAVWAHRKLPSYFPMCFRDDPDLRQCLLNATQTMRPFLKTGIPELGLVPLSPIVFPEIVVQQGSQHANYRAVLQNMTVTGLDRYDFTDFMFYDENCTIISTAVFPALRIESNLHINGFFLAIPLNVGGHLYINVSSANGTIQMEGREVQKGDLIYILKKHLSILIGIGDVTFDVEIPQIHNNVIYEAIMNVIRNNLQIVIEEVQPSVETVIQTLFETIVVRLMEQYPKDAIFPLLEQYH